ITDWPLPCQSSISSAACARTSSGRTAGPALKLNTFRIAFPGWRKADSSASFSRYRRGMNSRSPTDDVEGGVSIDALRALLQAKTRRPVERVETHISWVLLDGEHAWKLKKPVTLGFLDFARLDTRRACCEAELRLNRRLAPELYLDVVALRGERDAPRFDGDGAPIEYAVRMRQFAPGALFSERLADGTLDAETVERFGARLAAFHREAASA